MKGLSLVILCLAVCAMGLAGGYFAASQKSAPTHEHEHGGHAEADEHAGHDHGAEEGHDHAHEHAAAPKISPQAARNLGIETKEVDTAPYVQTRGVAGMVTPVPQSTQPLIAPVGGVISEVAIYPGAIAEGGAIAFRIVRDPLPRPTLVLTGELIKPAGEEIHNALGELRRAARGVEVLHTELERVRGFTRTASAGELPVLPRKTEIDLRYELARAEQELSNGRERLRLHGFSEAEVSALEKDHEGLPVRPAIWQQALKQNGLWPPIADDLFATLPAGLRDTAWSAAAIGELSSAGLATPELVAWLKENPDAAPHFLTIAGLLQQGSTLEQIRMLYGQGGLSPVVEVRLPVPDGAKDWDVSQVLVKPSEHVAAGAALAQLADARWMLLRCDPVASETPLLVRALKEKLVLSANPLLEGAGPALTNLRLQSLQRNENAGDSIAALVRVPNEALATTQSDGLPYHFRSWQLRAGERYLLNVPVRQFDDAYVLPAEAATDDGPDKVVFVRSGDDFEPRKVVVLHQDFSTVVLDPKFSDLFPGDEVVVKGAFGLALALKVGNGAVDPHAGHNH
jgi:hypothetical protein